jgi:hypothetical protein
MVVKHKQTWERENKLKRVPGFRKAIKYPSICVPENQLDEAIGKSSRYYSRHLNAVKTLEGDGMLRKRKSVGVRSYGSPWDVSIGYEFLLGTLEKYKEMAVAFPEPEHFRIHINLGWDKLEKCYSLLDETPIYYTALALHPAYRWDYFDEQWDSHPDWVAKAKEMVKDVWVTDYKPLEVIRSPESNTPVVKRQKIYPNAFEAHRQKARVKYSSPGMPRSTARELDEYEAWMESPQATDISIQDPIQYRHDLQFC